jgi:hypothetical protein
MNANGEHVLDEAGRHPLTARLSRRGFLGATVGASAGLALGSKLLTPPLVLADDESLVDPTPIPGGDSRHHFFPGRGKEISTINNFDGFVGIANVVGTGRAAGGTGLNFSIDNRFLVGNYVGVDGEVHRGAFAVF